MKRKEKAFFYFLCISMLTNLSMNLAHPVTPTFIKELNLGNYMFGVAFAAMSTGQFLLSPLVGKLTKSIGERKEMTMGLALYALGQFFFMMSKTEVMIVIARLFCGASVSFYVVSALTYILRISDEKDQGKNLTLYTTVQTVFATFGYLLGGVIGDFSIYYSFYLQIFFLLVASVLTYFLSVDCEKKEHVEITLKDVNPFKIFFEGKEFITLLLGILFVVTFVASLASTAYDQTFNYYIKDIFNFKPSYNGYIKAATGIACFAVNMTIAIYIQQKKDLAKSLVVIFLTCFVLLFAFVKVDNIWAVLVIATIYYATNSIYLPVLQNLSAMSCTKENSGLVMGYSTAMRSLGMIFGALIAGFIYDIEPTLPFIMASVIFLLSALGSFLYVKKR